MPRKSGSILLLSVRKEGEWPFSDSILGTEDGAALEEEGDLDVVCEDNNK